MCYEVNVAPISPKIALQLIQLLSGMGYYKTSEGKDDYVCTTKMIDTVSEALESDIPNWSTFDTIDIGIASMIIPVPPALNLANACFDNISVNDFLSTCHLMAISTDYFDIYDDYSETFIDEDTKPIALIAQYLRISQHDVSAKLFRKTFRGIEMKILKDQYDLGDIKDFPKSKMPWSEFTLTTCGAEGRFGPTLEECLSSYNTDWCRDKNLFDVDPNRAGIQKIKIVKKGKYEICAWGAGNKTNTGSGTVLIMLHYQHFLKFYKISVTYHLNIIDKYFTGAIITGNVKLAENEILHVAIGQKGKYNSSGSGGTFVIKENLDGLFTPMVIAGGAGADYQKQKDTWCNGQLEEYGNGIRAGEKNNDIGKDGKSGNSEHFSGGSGYKENRSDVTDLDPKCFTGGLHGGRHPNNSRDLDGGFGGGGTAAYNAGGGGYTGGNGNNDFQSAGGGGGSYNIDSNGTAKLGWYNPGQCKIKFIK